MTRKEAIEFGEEKLEELNNQENEIGYVTDDSRINLIREIEFYKLAIINMKLNEEGLSNLKKGK